MSQALLKSSVIRSDLFRQLCLHPSTCFEFSKHARLSTDVECVPLGQIWFTLTKYFPKVFPTHHQVSQNPLRCHHLLGLRHLRYSGRSVRMMTSHSKECLINSYKLQGTLRSVHERKVVWQVEKTIASNHVLEYGPATIALAEFVSSFTMSKYKWETSRHVAAESRRWSFWGSHVIRVLLFIHRCSVYMKFYNFKCIVLRLKNPNLTQNFEVPTKFQHFVRRTLGEIHLFATKGYLFGGIWVVHDPDISYYQGQWYSNG